MTVMLLQRSATLQFSHSQKYFDNNYRNEPPFLIFININDNTNLGLEKEKFTLANQTKKHRTIKVIGHINSYTSDYSGGVWSLTSKLYYGKKRRISAVSIGNFAMRYYRLWIYACNIVLTASTIGFVIAIGHTFIFSKDPRRYLVPGVPQAFDLTAIYAYLALTLQLGVVQFIGCIAARYLSAKLLNAYWLLLLALLFGDLIIGIAWIFRFERICAEFRPSLRIRLQVEYSYDKRFRENWDQLQREYFCCGVTGPLDFGSEWPYSCCPVFGNSTIKTISKELPFINNIFNGYNVNESTNTIAIDPCPNPHTLGCEELLKLWLKKTADRLFVLGFCVIAFTKLCFVGILRYEIREMIQKIKMLKEPPSSSTPFIQSLCPFAQHQQFQEQQLSGTLINNDNNSRRTTLPIITSNTSNGSIMRYPPEDDCTSSKHPLLASNLQEVITDSDTNSHSALILEERKSLSQNHTKLMAQYPDNMFISTNSNSILEMHEYNKRTFLHGIKPITKTVTTSTANNVAPTFKRT